MRTDKEITRREYEDALYIVKRYALQCTHLVNMIDLMIGVHPAEKEQVKPAKVEAAVSKEKAVSIAIPIADKLISEVGLSKRATDAIFSYPGYNLSRLTSTVAELSNVSISYLRRSRNVGASTVKEIETLCRKADVATKL